MARLPRGLAGVVFRHDGAPDRAALGRRIAALCRERRLLLVVAGDSRLAARLGAGLHLRAGRRPDSRRAPLALTSSAHGKADLRRAARAGAAICFLSPAFPTASHPGAPALGPARWAALARQASRCAALARQAEAGGPVIMALGGINGRSVRRLPRRACAGAGAIGALGETPGSACGD